MNSEKPFLAYRSFLASLNTIDKFTGARYDSLCLFPEHTVNSLGTPYSAYPHHVFPKVALIPEWGAFQVGRQ